VQLEMQRAPHARIIAADLGRAVRASGPFVPFAVG
jgi:hypothetical protein